MLAGGIGWYVTYYIVHRNAFLVKHVKRLSSYPLKPTWFEGASMYNVIFKSLKQIVYIATSMLYMLRTCDILLPFELEALEESYGPREVKLWLLPEIDY